MVNLVLVDLLVDEVHGADLGDERLNQRLIRIVERFGQSPNLTIPAATTSRAEMEADYRFFNNEKVSSHSPHYRSTLFWVASVRISAAKRC